MLLADTGYLQTAAVLVTGGLGVAIGTAVNWLYVKWQDTKNTTIGQYQTLLADERTESKRLEEENQKLRDEVRSVREECHDESRKVQDKADLDYRDLHSRYVKSQIEGEYQRGQILLYQTVTEARKAGGGTADLLGLISPVAYVTADRNGTITRAGPFCYPILHWPEAALVGKPITVLIPPRLREAHSAAFRKAIDPTHAVDETLRPLYAQTRGGDEIPIYLGLERRSEGKEPDGSDRWVFTAWIWKRPSEQNGSSKHDMPVADAASLSGVVAVVASKAGAMAVTPPVKGGQE